MLAAAINIFRVVFTEMLSWHSSFWLACQTLVKQSAVIGQPFKETGAL
jgi:hypothetical protein